MTHNIERSLLLLSPDEIREMAQSGDAEPLDPLMRQAVELCSQSHVALASSLAAERPRTLTSVVLARHSRRWRWRFLLLAVFLPMSILGLMLFGTAIAALVTAFFWR
jgi:hypothetical protein